MADDEPKEDEDVAAMFSLENKKKKKKKSSEKKEKKDKKDKKDKKKSSEKTGGQDAEDPGYSYGDMLTRVLALLQELNPELQEKKRHVIKPPQLMRVGTKRTLWANFAENCKQINRDPEHVFQFVITELGTEASINGTGGLLLKGKYLPKYIESLLRKYIAGYITCNMCRSPNTELSKDPVTRLHFLHCKNCGSLKSVAPIKSGFHAQTRAERRALRN